MTTATTISIWLYEVLPRYLLARKHAPLQSVPVLIDEQLSPLLDKLLEVVVGDPSLLIRVPRGRSIKVGRLHWVSDLSRNTVHTDDTPLKSDILLSPTAFALLRETVAPLFRHGVTRYQNMLITRTNVSFRRLMNRQLLRKVLEQKGFWGFDPGAVSFEEQVRAFSNAKCVIGEAGAALANLVFCTPGTTVIVLVNGFANSNYYYLAEMAYSLGLHLRFFECLRLIGSHRMGVHDDMVVDIQTLEESIRALNDATPEPPGRQPRRSKTARANTQEIKQA